MLEGLKVLTRDPADSTEVVFTTPVVVHTIAWGVLDDRGRLVITGCGIVTNEEQTYDELDKA